MKKINYFIVFLIIFLSLESVVLAKDATYVYEDATQKTTLTIKIDNLGKITYEKSGTSLPGNKFSGLDSDLFLDSSGNFLDSNSSPIAVLYASVDLSNSIGDNIAYKLSFESGSFTFNINKSSSKVNNDSSGSQGSTGGKSVVLNCPYYYDKSGVKTNININYYNDNTASSSATDGYFTFPSSYSTNGVPEYCPAYIYVRYIDDKNLTVLIEKPENSEYYTKVGYSGKNKNDAHYTNPSGDPSLVERPTNVKPMNICSQNGVKQVLHIAGYILFVAKLVIPLLLIIMGTIDIVSALKDPEDKTMKDSISKFVKRIIAAVIVFFIPTIVNFGFSLVDNATDFKNDFTQCGECLFKPLGGGCNYTLVGQDE